MTECEKLRSDLKAFLDGQLSPAARIAMRLHLNRCEPCRKEIEEMRLLGTNMRADDTLEMSDALRSRILAAVPTTAPEPKVKLLPKWREKPVLIWGASASAALAWFILYPAMSNYQDHASRSATATSNARQIGMASQLYTQDYDAGNPYRKSSRDTGFVDQHYYAGKPDVMPQWMQRRQIPIVGETWYDAPQGKVSGGRAPGDASVSRQTVLLTKEEARLKGMLDKVSGTSTLHGLGTVSTPSSDEKYIYFEADGAAVKPYTPKPPTPNGANSIVQAGDGSVQKQIHSPDGNQVAQSQTRIGGDIAAGNGHAVRKWVFPRTFDLRNGVASDGHVQYHAPLRDSGNVPIQVAQNTVRGTLAPLAHDAEADLTTERQVHKDASLTIEVANAEQQSEAVERLVKESKGYVAQNQLTTVEDGTRQASLTCKVPVDQFDTVMGQVARLGLLKGKTLSGEDITEKVSDEQETGHVLRADIATTEEKLKVRRRHSETVRDEETLRQLRIRVAQSQARLKMLTRLGALSEITVELAEKPKNAVPEQTKPASPFMEEVSGTGQAAAHSFLMALRLPVQLLVWIVVYSPLWALLIFGYRRMTR